MAKETIDAIRTLELKTAQEEADAKAEAQKKIQKAQDDAVVLLEDSVAREKNNAQQALTAAAEKEKAILEEQSRKTDAEILSMRQAAEAHKEQAIHLILESLAR